MMRKDRERRLTLNDLHQLAALLQGEIAVGNIEWQGAYDALENKIDELTPRDGGHWLLEV